MLLYPAREKTVFVANMEDVLEMYHRPYDEECPVTCMDENPGQILDECRRPNPMKPGKAMRYDSKVEIELSVLTSQCLGRSIPDLESLAAELDAWNIACNNVSSPVNWQFTTDDARIKLHRLYPDI